MTTYNLKQQAKYNPLADYDPNDFYHPGRLGPLLPALGRGGLIGAGLAVIPAIGAGAGLAVGGPTGAAIGGGLAATFTAFGIGFTAPDVCESIGAAHAWPAAHQSVFKNRLGTTFAALAVSFFVCTGGGASIAFSALTKKSPQQAPAAKPTPSAAQDRTLNVPSAK